MSGCYLFVNLRQRRGSYNKTHANTFGYLKNDLKTGSIQIKGPHCIASIYDASVCLFSAVLLGETHCTPGGGGGVL